MHNIGQELQKLDQKSFKESLKSRENGMRRAPGLEGTMFLWAYEGLCGDNAFWDFLWDQAAMSTN